MASATGYIRIENTTHNVAYCPVSLNQPGGAGGLIRAPGVLPIPGAGGYACEDWYADDAASDISGYRKLEQTNGSADTEYSCTVIKGKFGGFRECTIEEFATDAGDLDGRDISGACTFRMRAKYSWADENPTTRTVVVRVYHRTSGGSETLLGTWTQSVTTSYANYTNSFSFTQSFDTDERLVVKYVTRVEWPAAE